MKGWNNLTNSDQGFAVQETLLRHSLGKKILALTNQCQVCCKYRNKLNLWITSFPISFPRPCLVISIYLFAVRSFVPQPKALTPVGCNGFLGPLSFPDHETENQSCLSESGWRGLGTSFLLPDALFLHEWTMSLVDNAMLLLSCVPGMIAWCVWMLGREAQSTLSKRIICCPWLGEETSFTPAGIFTQASWSSLKILSCYPLHTSF